MTGQHKSFSGTAHTRPKERGNAMIYVLVIVALFAAINFILSRQSDTGETNIVDQQRVDFYATQIMDYSAQMRDSVERMTMTGTDIDDITFFQQGDAEFDSDVTYPHYNKLYHPQGGGMISETFPAELAAPAGSAETGPDAGWYVGRFNNVEWSYSSAGGNDVLLVAYRIPQNVCERINEMIAGDDYVPPPQLTTQARTVLIDSQNTTPEHLQSNSEGHSGGTSDLDTTTCPDCDGVPSLCVQNNNGDVFAYYDLIGSQ